jgi:hypothetical protein
MFPATPQVQEIGVQKDPEHVAEVRYGNQLLPNVTPSSPSSQESPQKGGEGEARVRENARTCLCRIICPGSTEVSVIAQAGSLRRRKAITPVCFEVWEIV